MYVMNEDLRIYSVKFKVVQVDHRKRTDQMIISLCTHPCPLLRKTFIIVEATVLTNYESYCYCYMAIFTMDLLPRGPTFCDRHATKNVKVCLFVLMRGLCVYEQM